MADANGPATEGPPGGAAAATRHESPVQAAQGERSMAGAGNDGGTAAPSYRRQRMWAITHSRYGSAEVLRIQEIDRPAIGDDEVLIQVHAAGLDRYLALHDWPAVRVPAGLRSARTQKPGPGPGHGPHRRRDRRPRHPVRGRRCGVRRRRGAFAEYAAAREGKLAGKRRT